MVNVLKRHIKHFAMGLEHMAVALTSILFVAATVGVTPSNAFLAVGLSTLIFHIFTKNKLSSVLGVSASYIGGMLLISQTLGNEYVGFGVLGIGLIYLGVGATLKKFPNLLNRVPKFIFKLSVVYISLLLIPIGWSMANSQIGFITVGILLTLSFIPKVKDYALPLSLLLMGAGTYYAGIWVAPMDTGSIFLTVPHVSITAFTAISLISISVIGEVFGDVSATAMINEVDLGKDVSWSDVFFGIGTANIFSSFFGVPTVSYSENNGFLKSIGERDLHPTAQIYTALIFIVMAFVPIIANSLSRVPFPVYGALLLFLFVNLGATTLMDIKFDKTKAIVTVLSLLAFILSRNLVVVSPITVSFVTSVVSYMAIKKLAI